MFCDLTTLKSWLLPESLRADYKWDDVITAIGNGVTEQFNTFTNRELEYTVGRQDIFRASLDTYIVSAYPIVTVSSIDSRTSLSSGWESETVNDIIYNYDADSGLVIFTSALGTSNEQIRLTYTGGYWSYSTTYPTIPTGATALPSDLALAFRTQCEKTWVSKDKLGLNITQDTRQSGNSYDTELDNGVESVLRKYMRYQIL